jgi:hypothetical protein
MRDIRDIKEYGGLGKIILKARVHSLRYGPDRPAGRFAAYFVEVGTDPRHIQAFTKNNSNLTITYSCIWPNR